MANIPIAQHVLKYRGAGDVQVFPLIGGVNTGAQDGNRVGDGGPVVATLEAGIPDGTFPSNRVVEFQNDRYCVITNNLQTSSGVYRKNRENQGGSGLWGRVRGGGSEWVGIDGHTTGLHVLHPNGIPTLVQMWFDSAADLQVSYTEDGVTGPGWGTSLNVVEASAAQPTTVGQSIVFKDSIFWAHSHFSGFAGAGSITQYNLKTQTLVRYDMNAVFRNGTASETGLHVHNGVLFAMNRGPAANSIRLAKLQGGIWSQVHSNTTIGSSGSGTNSHHALFTDSVTGDLIAVPNGGGGPGVGSQVWRFEDPAGSIIATDITSSVLGSVEGADKYGVGGGAANANRRWSVFVDTVTDPATPHIFLTTWIPGLSTETWEWVNQIGTTRPTTAAVELEVVGGGSGISYEHALPYDSVGGGHRTPRTAAVEIVDTPEEVLGGTKVFFRGYGDDSTATFPSSTLTFYGADTQGTPSTVIPIVPGSLSVGAGFLTDLEVYYKLDGTGNRVDSSGNGLDLTETGTVGTGTGIFANGASFPGVAGNYLERANTTSLKLGNSLAPFAVSFWIDLTIAGVYYVCSQENETTQGWLIVILGDGHVELVQRPSTVYATPAGVLTAAAGLQHVVVTSDGITQKIYVDGVEEFSGAALATVDSSATFRVGVSPSNTFPLNAILDELAIWSRYITPIEVEALYNANSSGGAGKELEDTTALPTTPSISGDTIVDFTADNGSTLYSVVLDVGAPGVDIEEGDIGIIITDLV
jgi:hypothetical protein